MPNVALTPGVFGWVPGQPGVLLTGSSLTSLTAATTITVPNPSGNVILIVSNLSASAMAVAPVIIRSVEQQTPTPAAITIAAGTVQALGPFPPNDFNVAGTITFNVSPAGIALQTAGAFQMSSAPAQI